MFLTARKVRGLTAPGKYNDGHGLILHVITAERRNWIFRYMRAGKDRMMGLGSAALVSLEEARQKAHEARKLLAEGVDPIDARQAAQAAAEAEQAARVSFAEAAAQFIAGHEAGWRNPKHRQQWRNTLDTYADPVLGKLPVALVGVGEVMRVLEPLWRAKTETASRLRGRIESVLDYAAARGWRTGENPARWRGHLDNLLPARSKVAKVEHHSALP